MGKIIKRKKDYNTFKLKVKKKTTMLDFLRKGEIPWGDIIRVPKKIRNGFLTKRPIIIPQYEIQKRRKYKRRKIKA